MKIAAHHSPDGKDGWKIGTGYRVLLDGTQVDRCVAADDETGEVWVVALDMFGNPQVNHAEQEIVTERRTGKVEIRPIQ